MHQGLDTVTRRASRVAERLEQALAEARAAVRGDLERGDQAVDQLLDTVHAAAAEPARAFLSGESKRLRETITHVAARAVAGDRDDLWPLGVAVRLVHSAALLHNDVIDDAPMRRWRKALHRTRGAGVAVATGDLLVALAFSQLARGCASPLVIAHLAEAIARMADGEALEEAMSWNPELSHETRQRINTQKTGSLIAWGAAAGARVAGAESTRIAALEAYGQKIGAAFQALDDLLDWVGSPDGVGKLPWRDIERGRFTMPVLLGLAMAPEIGFDLATLRDEMVEVDTHGRRIERIHDALAASGAFEAALAAVATEATEALTALAVLPRGEHRESLAMIARALA